MHAKQSFAAFTAPQMAAAALSKVKLGSQEMLAEGGYRGGNRIVLLSTSPYSGIWRQIQTDKARVVRASVGQPRWQGASSMGGIKRAELIDPANQRIWPQHVKRALTYMRANMAERITLTGLASACGVPERTLLRQFQRFVGLAPLAYLRRLRLNTAKSELASAQNNDAISDIAMRCGFSHLGRFATEYRRLFGETPSTTRQRVRVRAADSALAKNGASCFGDSPPSPLPAMEREKPSLLILPLRTETLQESLEARDLTERLAATLSRIRVAAVALARPSHPVSLSVSQPRNAGTQYCLRGRLTQRGERLRVIVRLVDVVADRHVWGDSFDGSVNDPFELQDRVVEAVLCGVVSHITDDEIGRASNKNPRDVGAYDLTLRALPLILNANAASAQKAVAILNHAVDIDPANSTALALLAYSQIELVGRYATTSPADALNAATRLSQRALLLDNNDPLALVASAGVAGSQGQSDEANSLLTRALAIDPTSAWAWERYAYSQLSFLPLGIRFEREAHIAHTPHADRVIADFRRALRLRGPRISRSNCFQGIALAHGMAGRWDEARFWMRKALAENPGGTWIHRCMSSIAFKVDDQAGVVHSVDHLCRAHPHLTVSWHADHISADPGWLEALAKAGMPLS